MSKKHNRKKAAAAAAAHPSQDPGNFRLPSLLGLCLLLGWILFAGKHYLVSHSFLDYLSALKAFHFLQAVPVLTGAVVSNVLNLLFLVLITLLAYGIGSGLMKLFKVEIPSPERGILAVGLGLGVLAYLMLLLGALGALQKWLVLPLFLAGTAAAAVGTRAWTFRAVALRNEFTEIAGLGFAWQLLVLLGLLFLGLNAVLVFTPEIFYDSLVYHLAVPKYYLLNNGIEPMRFLSHSNFPLNMSMLYMLALSLSDELLAKMLHGFTGVLAVLLTYLSVKRIYGARTAIFSALLLCSIPMFAMNSWTCGNDVAITFFFALAYSTYLVWSRSGETRHLVLLAVFAGIFAGSKYTTAFTLAGLTAAVAFHSARTYGTARAARNVAVLAGGVLLLMLPWLVKNYIFTDNPVQPFFYNFLGGENLKNIDGGGGLTSTPLNLFDFNFYQFLRSPWERTMSGGDSMNYLGPLFLFFLPCLFMLRKTDPLFRQSLLMVCAGYVVWGMGTPAYRYILPLFIPLAVCVGRAAGVFCERYAALTLLSGVLFLYNFAAVFFLARVMYLDEYFAGKRSRSESLSVSRPGYPNPPYAAIGWINRNLPADARVLFIGESRPYYLERDHISYSVETNLQPLMVYLSRAGDAGEFLDILRSERVTHLLVGYREALRVNADYKDFSWSERERKIFDEFWKDHVRLEHFKEGVYVYSISSEKINGDTANILEELAGTSWTNESLVRAFAKNRMWESCLEEYELYARHGYDVAERIRYLKSLIPPGESRDQR